MSFQHGITGREIPTSVVAAVSSGITPTYVGTAPINMCKEHMVNEPVLCYSYSEAIENFGFSKDFGNFTLCEAIDAHFSKFASAPIVLINVLDPEKHKKLVENQEIEKFNRKFILNDIGVIPETLKIIEEIDFATQFDDDGKLIIVPVTDVERITVSYDKIDPSMVTEEDIIGGVDVETGKKTGLECIENVFPKYRLVPNLLLAPKFSTNSAVAAVMETKVSKINGHFMGVALVDISTQEIKKYSDAPAKKNSNNLISTFMDVSWPKVALGDRQYHLSTQRACIIQNLASQNDNIPYKSPSNKIIKADRACLENGESVFMGLDEANFLNGNGITTTLNFIGGWKIWGNRNSCYPDNTDPKDCFLASRLMFNWLNDRLVQTFWQKVDEPSNKILIKTIVDTINIDLNGLVNNGVLLGARIEFREEDNPVTELINGKITFRIYLAPSLPAEEICFLKEIDINYFNNLF